MAPDAPGQRAPGLRRTSGGLERLLEIGHDLGARLPLEALLAELLEVAREMTGAGQATFGTFDPDRPALEPFLTSSAEPRTDEAIDAQARLHALSGLLAASPRPVRLEGIGEDAVAFDSPSAPPGGTRLLSVPVVTGDGVWGALYLTREDGDAFDEQDERSTLALSGWAALAIEAAASREAAHRDRQQHEQAVRGLEATVAIAQAIAGEIQLDRVLELIVERSRALVEARAMLILLVEDDELVLTARSGDAAEIGALRQRVPLAGSVFRRSLDDGTLDRVIGPFADVDAHSGGLRASEALVIPLRYRGRGVGMLVAFAPAELPGGFHPEQAELLASVAVTAGIAVWTARTVEDDRARRGVQAAEAERRRWARELHDGTLQGLGALQISVTSARRAADPALRDRVLAQAAEQATEEIAQLRTLITDLRPAALDELGIAAALEALVDRSQRDSPAEIRISTDFGSTAGAALRLSPELETAVYRVVQQALSNAVRHSGAIHIDVSAHERDGRVVLSVKDDGKGFGGQSRRTGFGLIGMQERVELEHGTLRVVSRPGEGTSVEAVLPVSRRAPE